MMSSKPLAASLLALLAAIGAVLLLRPFGHLNLEEFKCPLCYGDRGCATVKQCLEAGGAATSLLAYFASLVSAKNVFEADCLGRQLVLKKLAHSPELDSLDAAMAATSEEGIGDEDVALKRIQAMLAGEGTVVPKLKVCDKATADALMKRLAALVGEYSSWWNIWTLLEVNPEPLIIQLFPPPLYPVPELYGGCGRFVAEEHCGHTLNHFESAPWPIRARIAIDLLQSAFNFTMQDPSFALYLTDISPDNIALSDKGLRFVDLENSILAYRPETMGKIHSSERIKCDGCFAYSTEDICSTWISDHNVFSICYLLLSPIAPWPMMKGGLLHSMPEGIEEEAGTLMRLIDDCVNGTTVGTVNGTRLHTAIKIYDAINAIGIF